MMLATMNHSPLRGTPSGPADGIPVLLIHGFGASVGHWRNNIPAYAAAGYRTYAIDLLGFGGSDKPPQVNDRISCTQLQCMPALRVIERVAQ
jgi:pimeloyl-ACP methyl ester carboxylesterase